MQDALKNKINLILLAIALLAGAFLIDRFQGTGGQKPGSHSNADLRVMADAVLEKCKSAKYRPTCYEDEVPALMDGGVSMEQAFEVTRLIQEKDRAFRYCHVLGHNLSAKETAKDPDRWKEVVARSPSGLCSNGGIHGAFQERFRTESLSAEEIEQYKPDFLDICEAKPGWQPTGLEQASCYHALGHLMMYITDAEKEKALVLCDEIALKDEGRRDMRQLCFDGVFMQIFQPLEPEDFALVEGKVPKKEDMAAFCQPHTGLTRGPCWNESWPLFRSQISKPEGLTKFCSEMFLTAKADIDRCYSAMFYIVTAQMEFNSAKLVPFCSKLLPDRRGQCFANAASRMIETDYRNITPASALCSAAPDAGSEVQCFEELLLYSTYNYHPGSLEFLNMCAGLPETWKEKCLAKSPSQF